MVNNKFIDVTDLLLEDAFEPRLTSSGFSPKSHKSAQRHHDAYLNEGHRLCATELMKKTHATTELITELIQETHSVTSTSATPGLETTSPALQAQIGAALGKALGDALGNTLEGPARTAFEAAFVTALEAARVNAKQGIDSHAETNRATN